MHIADLEAILEYELAEAVQRHHPLDWDENSITHDFLIRWRARCQEMTLYGIRYPVHIEWEIYKLRGTPETAHGDIGVLVRYRLPNGSDLEGAGFLEAKVRARDSNKFNQIRPDQIATLIQRSRQTRLLLYDYQAVPVLDDSTGHFADEFSPHRFRRHMLSTQITHGAVIPIELAVAVNQYDDALYRFSHSLPYQFVRRYFQLHDLDFSEAAISAVKSFPTGLGSPRFVMVVRASVLGQELPERFVPRDNLYDGLE